ncbi:hypothetical protein [Haloarcula laminariae]|uniref:hypothetical protein n=1 Tax=Haloarcula laminariae TaxID=2961577 RepID=UPI0024066C48|nr:hypothetical protein [Halomicroarcula sp. FL173]
MSAGNDQIRTELERKFEPPIDVMLDPSLLVASRSLSRLSDSNVFTSQTQATLGGTPTQPRLGELYVPAAFYSLLTDEAESTAQKSNLWDFYRGQAEPAFPDDVGDLLDQNSVEGFSGEAHVDLQWGNAVSDPDRRERLLMTLKEEFSFLANGGVLLSRSPAALSALRDAGLPTVDVGKAELAPELRETLAGIGYRTPAAICSFAVSSAQSTVDALTGSILRTTPDTVLYQLGD